MNALNNRAQTAANIKGHKATLRYELGHYSLG